MIFLSELKHFFDNFNSSSEIFESIQLNEIYIKYLYKAETKIFSKKYVI